MTYPRHWLFSFGGDLLGGAEIWSNNIRFAIPEGQTEGVVDEGDMLADLMKDLQSRFTLAVPQGGLGYGTGVRLKWGKFNEIDAAGHYADQNNTRVLDLPSPVPGIGQSLGTIPQLALAVSWGTARQRGLASRGRIYIPMPAVTTSGASGRVLAATAQSIATNWAMLLEEFNDWATSPDLTEMTAHVVSNVGEGAKEQITTVRVGDVLDTMRSRRNALVEVYAEADVPDVDA